MDDRSILGPLVVRHSHLIHHHESGKSDGYALDHSWKTWSKKHPKNFHQHLHWLSNRNAFLHSQKTPQCRKSSPFKIPLKPFFKLWQLSIHCLSPPCCPPGTPQTWPQLRWGRSFLECCCASRIHVSNQRTLVVWPGTKRPCICDLHEVTTDNANTEKYDMPQKTHQRFLSQVAGCDSKQVKFWGLTGINITKSFCLFQKEFQKRKVGIPQ